MKYIRTKDSVQKLGIDKELKKEGVRNYYFYKWKGIKMLMDKNDVKKYKQADTIEELCDEFVVVYKDSEPYLTQHLSYAEMEIYNAEINKNDGELYGAIWTDKGLIYVAKMNDKGELELL